MVAKSRIVVTFRLVLRLHVSKVSAISGIEGSVINHRDREGRASETQNCRHFGTRLASSRLKCHQSQGSGDRGREAQNCRHCWIRLSREERREKKREMRGKRREEES